MSCLAASRPRLAAIYEFGVILRNGNAQKLFHSSKREMTPTSIVPIIAKVFERIIYDQVYGYLPKTI